MNDISAGAIVMKNPKVGYPDLVEAVRKGNCRQQPADCSLHGGLITLPPTLRTRNWAVPSYDISLLINSLSDPTLQIFIDEYAQLFRRKQLMLPHDAFCTVEQIGEFTFILYVSAEFDNLKYQGGLKHNNKTEVLFADFWLHHPNLGWFRSAVHIKSSGIYFTVPFSEVHKKFNDISKSNHMSLMAFLVMLMHENNKEIFRLARPASNSHLASINRGRAQSNLAPLPETQRVLVLSPEPITRIEWLKPVATGSGSPKKPHVRRGHWHRFGKDKLKKWVGPISVKGGGFADTITVKLNRQFIKQE